MQSQIPARNPVHKRFRVQVKIASVGVVADVFVKCNCTTHAGKCTFTAADAIKVATPNVDFISEEI